MNIVLVLFLFLVLTKDDDSRFLISSSNNDKILDLDIPYTMQKIKVIKKIGPYFPEEYLPSINKGITIAEKIIKLYETLDFIQVSEANYIKDVVPVENNQERLSYIASTIQKEFSKDEIENMGTSIDTILKFDRYNKMFSMINYIMSNPDTLNNSSNMLDLMEPFLQGKDEKERKKMKDMSKMLEVLKTLDSPTKSKDKENKTNKEENNNKNL